MSHKNFTTSILVEQPPLNVYKAINNVRGWWSENIEGRTDQLDAEYLYHYKDVHVCKIKIKELVPGKKVVWQVLENHFNFINGDREWKDDEIVFEISGKGKQTELHFTQNGLTTADECYDVCHDAWTGFIKNSLFKLITTGKGEPTPKDTDGVFNEELIEKWNLNERKKVKDFSFSFLSSQSAETVYKTLLDAKGWWAGLYGEEIKGKSSQLNEEYSFRAGNGAHYSKQKLIEALPDKRIVWLVTDSNLSFLKQTDEWVGTKIRFDISPESGKMKITFTHEGLIPKIECYRQCTSGWTQYLQNLERRLK
jgi:Activator of Hsp90 ATPase homolog 1-like protein